MKNKVLKFISSVLAVFMLISFMPISDDVLNVVASAETVNSGICGDELAWTLDENGTLTISGTGKMYDFADPSTFNKYHFQWTRNDVKRVVISDGVTSIGDYAFADNYYMSDIQIPDSVTEIGKCAFEDCSSLLTVELPENIETIPYGAFFLSALRHVYIPSGVKQIEAYAFDYTRLIEVTFGGTQKQWENVSVANNNDKISTAVINYSGNVTIPEIQSGTCGDGVNWTLGTSGTLTISGSGRMSGFKADKIDILNDDSDGSDHPWYKFRSRIKEIVIESGVEYIGAYAFNDCFNAVSVKIENGVKEIGEGAFAETSIASVTIPDSVTDIGAYVFSGCVSLKKAVLPENIKVISNFLFYDCYNMEEVNIPSSVETIGYSAFSFCVSMKDVYLPESLSEIGGNFLYGADTVLHFSGPLPEMDYTVLNGVINCKPQYYDEYKAFYVSHPVMGTLFTGDVIPELSDTSVSLSAEVSEVTVTVKNAEAADDIETVWTVDDTSVASVDKSGTVSASGHGNTRLFAEIFSGDSVALTACEVYSKRNELLVAQLPSELTADAPVTCGTSMEDMYTGEVVGYQPGKLIETDTENEYYKMLLELTEGLTADCETDTQKARAIQSWVSDNITYAGSIGIGNTVGQVYAVYLERSAHCEGFAKLTGFMLYLAGIPNGIVTSVGHMWNIAYVDGKWIMIDSTAGDFGFDYNDCATIEYIAFGEGDCCFMVDGTDGVKLVGVGNNYLDEARENITEIVIPDYTDEIFGCAFNLCENLESVYVPASVSQIGKDAFEDCYSLSNVIYAGNEESWNDIDVNESGNENLINASIHFENAHFLDESTSFVIKPATCTEKGLMGGFCICGESMEKVIPVAEHDYNTIVTEPTCQSEGFTTFMCKDCGYSYVGDKIPVSDHEYEKEVTAPTCTAGGFTTYTCKVCKTSYKDDFTAALGHDFDASGECTRCDAVTTVLSFTDEKNITVNDASKTVIVSKTITAGELLSNISSGTWTVTDKDGNVAASEDSVVSGNILSSDAVKYTVVILGDVNSDGRVNASDARLVLRVAAKIDTASELFILAGNCDGKEKITAADARIILRVSAKVQTF